MSMTKKDFTAIAAKFAEVRNEYKEAARVHEEDGRHRDVTACENVQAGIDIGIYRLCEAFAAVNPNFDRPRFLEACGIW